MTLTMVQIWNDYTYFNIEGKCCFLNTCKTTLIFFCLIAEFAVGQDESLVQTRVIRNICNLRSAIGTVNKFVFQRDEYMPSVAKVSFMEYILYYNY